MLPEIAEFSYGFALTNELAAMLKVQLAPVFQASSRRESRAAAMT